MNEYLISVYEYGAGSGQGLTNQRPLMRELDQLEAVVIYVTT